MLRAQVLGDAATALNIELSRHSSDEFALLNLSARLEWNDATRGLIGVHWFGCAARAYPLTPYIGEHMGVHSRWREGRWSRSL